jgi:hypothetical protein
MPQPNAQEHIHKREFDSGSFLSFGKKPNSLRARKSGLVPGHKMIMDMP